MSKVNFNRRKKRVRFKLKSKSNKPKLCVFISNSHIYVQLIDVVDSKTLASSSSLQLKEKKLNIETAKKVGLDIADKAKKIKVKDVVFDRGGYLYHGRVKALADEARSAGLNF